MLSRLYTLGLSLYLAGRMPAFLFEGLARGKHDLPRRLREGCFGPQIRLKDGNGEAPVWVHACSLGEVLAAAPLLRALRQKMPRRGILLSTVTRTGYEVAVSRLVGVIDDLFYFPFDLPGSVRRALDKTRPAAVVIVETEIWPNFLGECYKRRIPVVWVNGRVSDRAFRRYQLASRLLSPLLRQARLFIMRTEEDARRIRTMGADAGQVVVGGNLKYDRRPAAAPQPTDGQDADSLGRALAGAAEESPLLVAGSTTEPEEQIVLETFGLVRRHPGLEGTRLLIAPRHPERFERVAAMLESSGLRFRRRSQGGSGPHDVFLLDTIGELAGAYAFADAVFVGGSFARRGGQSILEPAAHGRAAVVGPHMENFREVLADFKTAGAVIQIKDEEPWAAARRLARIWTDMLQHPDQTRQMGQRALTVLERNAGATTKTLEYLLEALAVC
ncbi:MAG: glycosyltransferase N-terminal domain-containing protein [Pseudomonadota bacterium]